MGNIFNQNHSGSGDNVINVGQQRFQLTEDILHTLAKKVNAAVPRGQRIMLKTLIRDRTIGDRLEEFLRKQGWDVERTELVMLVMKDPLQTPITVNNRSDHCEMILDASVSYG